MTDNPNVTPTVPAAPPAPGTVDITNVVEAVRSSFVTFAVSFVLAAAATTPWLAWTRLPVISQAFSASLKWVMGTLSESAVMEAFFLNTTIRKQGQAHEFIDAVDALASLPKTASREEYANAEAHRMAAFRNFVMLTN